MSRKVSPSRKYSEPNFASQIRTALRSMVANTGSNSPGDLAMTLRTCAVAFSRSNVSSRSRTLS